MRASPTLSKYWTQAATFYSTALWLPHTLHIPPPTHTHHIYTHQVPHTYIRHITHTSQIHTPYNTHIHCTHTHTAGFSFHRKAVWTKLRGTGLPSSQNPHQPLRSAGTLEVPPLWPENLFDRDTELVQSWSALRVARLANTNTGYPVKFKYQISRNSNCFYLASLQL